MTINVAVVSAEALVLGCDSISTVTEYFLNPFAHPADFVGSGRYQVSFSMNELVPQVTNSWDGVTKMFALSSDSRTPVAAVTAGLARLNDRSMKSYADEFLRDKTANALVQRTVEEVANNFLIFMRRHYDQHYADSPLPPELRDGPVFLVGGYNAASHMPSLFRVNVQNNSVILEHAPGTFGIAWDGQSDAVERLMRGYDIVLRDSIERQINAEITALRKIMDNAATLTPQKILDRTDRSLLESMDNEPPEVPRVSIDWDNFKWDIAYGNLPVQDLIDLTAYLVGLQSGRAKFGKGIATVGGRTRIGLIRKQEGVEMLNESELRYTRVGAV